MPTRCGPDPPARMTGDGEAERVAESDPVWARRVTGGWALAVRVQPGARRSEVVGPLGEVLRIKVAAPAHDGKANAELVRFLAEVLHVPRRSVQILRGRTSRSKVVLVAEPIPLSSLQRVLAGE